MALPGRRGFPYIRNVLNAALVVLLAASARAQDLPSVSFHFLERGGPAAPIKAQEARRKAPDFFFFSLRTEELVLLRDNPQVRRQVLEENGAYRQDMPVRVLAGSPVLVYFWAPYCKACPDAMDAMQALHDEWGLKLWVVGLGMYGPDQDVRAITSKYTHHIGRHGGNAAGELGIGKMPGWALIDKAGNVVASSDAGVDAKYLSNRIRELVGN